MYKVLIFNVFLFFILHSKVFCQGQELYHVVYIKSEIINKTDGNLLKPGDKLRPKDELIFKTPDALAIVLSAAKGRYILKGTPDKKKDNSGWEELTVMVKNLLLPDKPAKLASRFENREDFNYKPYNHGLVNNLNIYFGNGPFAFIGDTAFIRLAPTDYPLSDEKYLVAGSVSKEQGLYQRIPFIENTIMLVKSDIQPLQPAGHEPISLRWNTLVNTSGIGATFIPVFIPEEKLKTEVIAITDTLTLQQYSKEEILELIRMYVEASYGRTDIVRLKEWVNRIMNW